MKRIAKFSVDANSEKITPYSNSYGTVIGKVNIYSDSETQLAVDVILKFDYDLPEGAEVYIGDNVTEIINTNQYSISTTSSGKNEIAYDISIMLPKGYDEKVENNCNVEVKAEQVL